MSRRPAPPDQSEKNRATLKQLVKLEANKSCADCKRNKHPRWASWNLGVFVCIRCSGIHRSMGVHISRVKSVDLDTWTEEQMASILRWGNARANKYWEAKLAPGHVPNEAKIENFIRTKYDSKRWVMDGPMPDPSTLDDEGADDDTPLNVVQEKAKIERNTSVRNGSAGIAAPRAPAVDLFGDVMDSTPARPSTTEPATRAPPSKAPAQARQTKPGESLLGLDFFGGAQSAPPRPSSTTGVAASNGRADLKNSILSLYASVPKAAPAAAPAPSTDLFGSIAPSTSQSTGSGGLADLGDAFGSLSFSSAPSKSPATTTVTSPVQHTKQPSALSGGSFFDTKPAQQAKPTPAPVSLNNDFGDFGGFESSAPAISSKPVTSAKPTASKPAVKSSTMDLFDLSEPAPPPSKASNPPPISSAGYTSSAAFNLSQPKAAPAAPVQTQTSFASVDAWGSNDAWATPDPAPAPAPVTKAAPPPQTSTTTIKPAAPVVASTGWGDTGGWGEPEPVPKPASSTPAVTSSGGFTVTQDEEFGGWSHASPVATSGSAKPAASNADDLFGNVWE